MQENEYGELVCDRATYHLLRKKLAEVGVVFNWSSTNCQTYKCYIQNPYKVAVELWGTDLVKEQAHDFYERYSR